VLEQDHSGHRAESKLERIKVEVGGYGTNPGERQWQLRQDKSWKQPGWHLCQSFSTLFPIPPQDLASIEDGINT
jgi:hypothetical protein